MTRFHHSMLMGIAVFFLAACHKPALQAVLAPPAVEASQVLLTRLVERYWDETAAASPWYSWGGAEMHSGDVFMDALSPQALGDALAVEQRYLTDVLLIPRAPLDAEAKQTYDIFWRERKLAIESFTFPTELMPVNPYEGVPQRFALMALAAERHALASDRDRDNWRLRAVSFQRWSEQAIANMREGLRRGNVSPRGVVEGVLPLLASLGEDSAANVFYQPLAANADSAALTTTVRDVILPSYRALHDFMQREYLPRVRDSVGLSALPLGDAWYGYLTRRATSSEATPAELHAMGLTEVEHAQARIHALLAETAYAGNASGFLDSLRHDPRFSYGNAEDLLGAYTAFKTQVVDSAAALFPAPPKADFAILSVEGFREKTMPPVSYRPSLAYGKNPAVLYVNTGGLGARPATDLPASYLREAVPGHHYQIALQQERSDLPRFRRFGGTPAFVAGWGLYAASLGEELGVYHGPEARFGALLAQLVCAIDMVIDTGIHSQRWSRQQAIDYVHAQSPIDDVAVAYHVDRVIALPGEALACSGFFKIQALRTRTQQLLGAHFDPAAFHTEILRNGAIPLDLLDADIKRWAVAVNVAATANVAPPPPVD